MPPLLERSGFAREFGYPCALVLLAGVLPRLIVYGLLRTATELTLLSALATYAADSWLYFTIIVVCVILVSAVLQQIQLRRLLRTGR